MDTDRLPFSQYFFTVHQQRNILWVQDAIGCTDFDRLIFPGHLKGWSVARQAGASAVYRSIQFLCTDGRTGV